MGAVLLGWGMTLGCNAEPEMEVVPVSGTVQLDGKPVEGVSITLLPQSNGMRAAGFGTTDSNGQYTLQAGPEIEGVPPGNYRVLFSKMAMPDGSPIPPDAMAADVGAVNVLPEKYNSVEFSGVTLTVPPPNAEATNFELSSSGR
ncbi:carboxypeptidase-like regulatory domain-containing protein [Candidatus Laterigemmans baculatus]|uniref:carboxypeptidase-like regulatory domain-containing protein n=1 Tax=Candidatus Laterigemmans baculatus TaxID=2770505 RepID=UPI0013DB3A4E|nr:carboxypeptidase-like regulatory domain-containing protein [Candidatus Laterigemmans baculatus]